MDRVFGSLSLWIGREVKWAAYGLALFKMEESKAVPSVERRVEIFRRRLLRGVLSEWSTPHRWEKGLNPPLSYVAGVVTQVHERVVAGSYGRRTDRAVW